MAVSSESSPFFPGGEPQVSPDPLYVDKFRSKYVVCFPLRLKILSEQFRPCQLNLAMSRYVGPCVQSSRVWLFCARWVCCAGPLFPAPSRDPVLHFKQCNSMFLKVHCSTFKCSMCKEYNYCLNFVCSCTA